MKRNYTLLLLLLATVSILAQTPEKMSYQAVLRDASNTLLTNQEVGMQISILQNTATSAAVYVETQTPTTNLNGLVSLEIGTGSTSDSFASIDWSAGPYFIKIATDPNGGSSYSITGTSQLMSVPFAMYAKTSGSSIPGPQGEPGTNGTDGTQGIQGEIGTAGADGTQGIQGEIGTPGAAGTNGTSGTKGDTGNVGEKGDTGAQGTQGIQGEIGTSGAAGADGATGAAGTNGTQGIQGDTGSVGADGAVGTNGTTGDKGDTGIAGDKGNTGEKGDPGDQGIRGIQGETGVTGADINLPTAVDGNLITYDGANWVAATPKDAVKITMGTTGGNLSFNNRDPYLGLTYLIALRGIFPSRNSYEPFIGEIMIFGGNFVVRDWAFCDGQLLAITSNTALFSIIGTTYGGDGRTTFALPDLRGRSAIHVGTGPGLSPIRWGDSSGTETNTLTTSNLPSHTHTVVYE
jgi:microcystin-dependent protein